MEKKNKKIKQPVSKGFAKVPVVMQMEALECGAASLAMVMAYYEKWVPLEQVRRDCGVSRDGSNARNVLLAARNYGFDADGYRMEVDALREHATFPCIIHWNFNHFVVLDGFKGNKAVINDPASGVEQVSMEEFDQSFTGICLIITPGENFVPSGKKKSTIEFAAKRLSGTGTAVAFVMLSSIIASLFGIINPVMSRIFIDRLLTGLNPQWLNPFILLMAVLCVTQLIVEWVQVVYSLKINGKMAVVGSTSYMWKILKLPLEFFSQRMAGDILQRMETNASIAGTLVETAAPLLLNTVMAIVYLVLMFRYSPALTLIGLLSVFMNLLIARYMSEKRVNVTRVQMRDAGKLASTTVAGISMAETIKSSGAENGFFRRWSGYQASVNKQVVNTYYGYSYGRLYLNASGSVTLAETDASGNPNTSLYYFAETFNHYHPAADADEKLVRVNGRIYTTKNHSDEQNVYDYAYGWLSETSSDGVLFQIPVLKVRGLEYGTYNATIQPRYASSFDVQGAGNYDVYVDGIRVYDPAGTGDNISAVVADEPRLSRIRRGLDVVRFRVYDDSAEVSVTYFNQPYVRNQLQRGSSYRFFGRMEVKGSRRSLTNPVFESEELPAGRMSVTTGSPFVIVPVLSRATI